MVEVTKSLIVFLLAIPVLAVVYRGDLWRIAAFVAIFQASAVINLGASGRQVGIGIILVLLPVATVAHWLFSRKAGGKLGDVSVAYAFMIYAVASGILFPILFRGTLISNPGRAGSNVPLQFSGSNVTQALYLITLVLASRAIYQRVRLVPLYGERIADAYIAGCTVASIVGGWQLAALLYGIPYPAEWLYTNGGFVMHSGYRVGGFYRINATFSEPSIAALHYGVAAGFLAVRSFKPRVRVADTVLLLVMTASLVMTGSSTGLLVAAVIVVVVGCLWLRTWYSSVPHLILRLGVALLFAVAAGAVAQSDRAYRVWSEMVDRMIVRKEKSASFDTRQAWDRSAIAAGTSTYGVGVGWGSIRASSLGPNVFGSVGIIGCMLGVAMLYVGLYRPLRCHYSGSEVSNMGRSVATGALVGWCALCISVPDPIYWPVWMFTALGMSYGATRGHARSPGGECVLSAPMRLSPTDKPKKYLLRGKASGIQDGV